MLKEIQFGECERCVRVLGSAAENNYSRISSTCVISRYPGASYIDERTLTHELVVNLRMYYTKCLMISNHILITIALLTHIFV